jgi:ABC-type transporter Mla maintaining outer membrane lipid asymmetry permease subunit MlaE
VTTLCTSLPCQVVPSCTPLQVVYFKPIDQYFFYSKLTYRVKHEEKFIGFVEMCLFGLVVSATRTQISICSKIIRVDIV